MTTMQLARRLERIEARRNPGAVFVCSCMLFGYDGDHAPDCRARLAGDLDEVMYLARDNAQLPAAGRVIKLTWDE